MHTTLLKDEFQNPGLTSWAAAAMIMSYAFGIGVFSLPHACAVLGWLHFGALLFVNLGGWTLSATLYMAIYSMCPQAKTLPDAARHAFGIAGQSSATFLQVGFNTLFAASVHLTMAIALSDAFGGALSRGTAWLLVGLGLLILLQARNIESLTILTALGAAGIILPCLAMLSYFFIQGFSQSRTAEAVTNSPWQRTLTAYMNVIFAWSGQHIWIDVQAQCKGPRTFRMAVVQATLCITAFYVLISFAAYFCLGKNILQQTDPVTHYVDNASMQLFLNIFVIIHCAVGYYVCGHVFIRCCEQHVLPGVDQIPGCKRFTLAVAIVGFAFTLSFVVPFFTDLLAVSTAIFLVILTYTYPLILYLRLAKLTRSESWTYRCLIIASVGLVLAGLASSIMSTIEDVQKQQ